MILRTRIHLFILYGLGAGLLLALGFSPLGWWPLIPLGLALLWYAAARGTAAQAALSGFIAGTLLELYVSYQGLGHMGALFGAGPFSALVRVSPPLIGLMHGIALAAAAAAWHQLRGRSALLNALCAAALYTACELLQQAFWQGYFWPALAQQIVTPPTLMLASVGGAALATFCIAFGAALAVEYARSWREGWPALAAGLAGIAALCALGALSPAVAATGSLTIATVQVNGYVPYDNGLLGGAAAQTLAAAALHADLAVYPGSPMSGAVYRGAGFAAPRMVRGYPVTVSQKDELARFSALAGSSTVVVWPEVYDAGTDRFFETVEFIGAQGLAAQYQKRALYPFTDYYPAWMRALGLTTRADMLTPGPDVPYTQVGAWRIGVIDCSEVELPWLPREEARQSDFLLSIGSDTVFADDLPERYSLASARYRAAENGVPLVRAALTGPSAIIGPDGSVQAMLPAHQTGVLTGTVSFERRATLYARLGPWPLLTGIVAVLGLALYARLTPRRQRA